MSAKEEALLKTLKTELEFIEKGGYRRHAWRPLFVFEDSPTCLNYRNPEKQRPCTDCALLNFVPFESREAGTPCRHIRLNENGETLETLYRFASQEEMERCVTAWLKETIHKLESPVPPCTSCSSITSVHAEVK